MPFVLFCVALADNEVACFYGNVGDNVAGGNFFDALFFVEESKVTNGDAAGGGRGFGMCSPEDEFKDLVGLDFDFAGGGVDEGEYVGIFGKEDDT